MKTINLNTEIRAKLTAHGVLVHNAFYRKTFLAHTDWTILNQYILKEGDYFKGELWDFMHIFGPHIFMGAKPVTETTNLEVTNECVVPVK